MDINPVTSVNGLSFTVNRQRLIVRETVLLFFMLIRWVWFQTSIQWQWNKKEKCLNLRQPYGEIFQFSFLQMLFGSSSACLNELTRIDESSMMGNNELLISVSNFFQTQVSRQSTVGPKISSKRFFSLNCQITIRQQSPIVFFQWTFHSFCVRHYRQVVALTFQNHTSKHRRKVTKEN